MVDHETKIIKEFHDSAEITDVLFDTTKIEDVFCDTTKIADFKCNLTILAEELTDAEKQYQFTHAKRFVEKACERDFLFCDEISYKKSTKYEYNDEWKLLLTGYVFEQTEGIEENSASLFVMTILRNNKFWFTDILEDLMGEIQVELNGFNYTERQITIWGQAYPYFQPDYGKFRMVLINGNAHYEFQCPAQH